MAELPITTQCGTGAPAAPRLDSSFSWNDEMGGGNLSRIVVRDMLS